MPPYFTACTRLTATLSLVCGFTVALAEDAMFAVQEITTQGRVVGADVADFNGDQQQDLMVISFSGVPPHEGRVISIYLSQIDGTLPPEPTHRLAVPHGSSVYDIADLRETPGDELLLLRPDGVTLLSVATPAAESWNIAAVGANTTGAAADERGLDRFKLVYTEFGDQPLIVIPQLGLISLHGAVDGALVGQLAVAPRTNYFIADTSAPFSVESDMQLFLDVPKLSVGDVDGDGRADAVTSSRHELKVFLQTADGRFARDADDIYSLELISEDDHTVGSGSVVVVFEDIGGDGKLDLLVTHVAGSFSAATTTTYIHNNHGDGWDLNEPDTVFVSKGRVGSDLLVDFDNDAALELVRVQLKFSVLLIIQLLITRRFDTQIVVHRLGPDGLYAPEPWAKKKVSTGLSLENFSPTGFLPRTSLDINSAELLDLVTSGKGDALEVYLGDANKLYGRRTAKQALPTNGRIRFTDINGDDLPDFVLFTAQKIDEPVRVGVNLGRLPQ